MLTATYSPEDNKLRIYSSTRLDKETFDRIRHAGYKWAPKQELFVAPMWTPERADLALELCDEIEDETMSLAERAEMRAERFAGYSESRTKDAERAQAAVHAIADNIPFGQPILVGHHSERHARKDAERIENGMRKTVQMWRTAEYWRERARGSVSHANYKSQPGVRARRIKGLQTDERRELKKIKESSGFLKYWRAPLETLKRKDGSAFTLRQAVIYLANMDGGYWGASVKRRNSSYDGPMSLWEAAGGNISNEDPETICYATAEQVQAKAIQNHERRIAYAERWLEHIRLRLEYERTALGEETPARVAVHRASVTPIDNPAARAMRESLRAGVKPVAVPQLFQTPQDLADRMAELANLRPGARVLEPSAGMGRLVQAALRSPRGPVGDVYAVEVNAGLAHILRDCGTAYVHCGDFLEWMPPDGIRFDSILMNPPFEDGADIRHIQHAAALLSPEGGTLVAICAGGPRQEAALRPRATLWEPLPAGTFTGTQVRAVLLKIVR